MAAGDEQVELSTEVDRLSDAAEGITAPAKRGRRALNDAVLPLVGVLLGGFLAAGASLITASIETKAQERQAIEQYRRDNRETIYSDLLAEVAGVDNVMKQVQIQTAAASVRKPLNGAESTNEEALQIYNLLSTQFQPAYDKLSTAISDVELVGSHRVVDLSKALQNSFFVSFNELVLPRDVILNLGIRGLKPAAPATSAQGPQGKPTTAGDQDKDGVGPDQNLADLPPATLRQMLISAAKEDLAFTD